MGSPTRMCVASDLKSRILEPLLAHQRKAQKEGRGVDLHLQAGDGQTTSLHQVRLFLSVGNFSLPQVMVIPRSPMLRNLALSLEGSLSLTLIIPDTLSTTLQLLVSLLYGSTIPITTQAFAELCSLCTSLDLHDWLYSEVREEDSGEKSTGSCEVELITEVYISPKINISARTLKMALHKNPGMHYSRVLIFLHGSSNISARFK